VQAAGKGVQVICYYHEIDTIIETLDPRGVFLTISGVPSREAAEGMLKKLEKWCGGKVF
jgi:hypothetical protein